MTQPQMHQPEREQLANSDPNPEHDIKDESLLPDEVRLRKSVKYGAALLCAMLVFGMWGSALQDKQLIEASGKVDEMEQLHSKVTELEMRQKVLFELLAVKGG